jgi:methionyl-tRNA formyltransferase
MNIVFAGTPELAVPSLRLIAEKASEQGDSLLVLTNPDRPKGRKRILSPSPVKAAALELGLPVYQPESLRTEARDHIAGFKPDLLVVVAYGRIFGPRFLSLFSKGGINLHPSLLPKYRGASPIPSAILNGDSSTGITIQQVALEMDSGDILIQEELELTGEESTSHLLEWAGIRGAELLYEAISQIRSGEYDPIQQDSNAVSYCDKISKSMAEIDWSLSAKEIERRIRAFDPWPGTYTMWGQTALKIHSAEVVNFASKAGEFYDTIADAETGTVVAVDKAHGILIKTGEGFLALQSLQKPGKSIVSFKDFLNGTRDFLGTVLGG